IDLATCFLIAEIARRAISERAAKIAFLLAALCPFTAIYCAAPLTETLSIFMTAGALLAVVCALEEGAALQYWILAGIGSGLAILRRRDGGLLLAAIVLYVGSFALKRSSPENRKRLFAGSMIICVIVVATLVPWTLRNWYVFHVIQPLAPRYANAPGE